MDGADHGCLVANHHFWVTGTKGLGFEEASIFPKNQAVYCKGDLYSRHHSRR
jgi:hypothetical protein